MADILRKYESDFGKTYVQVLVDNQNIEFAFDHDPTQAEIDEAVLKLQVANNPEPTIELEAENGKIT